MSPSIPLSSWPVKVVETNAEEAGREEGVGEGQHPGVHGPHHSMLQAPLMCPGTSVKVGCKLGKYYNNTPDWY